MDAGLGIALGLVTFGALVAYRRRKHAWTLMRKIQAHEIYASRCSCAPERT